MTDDLGWALGTLLRTYLTQMDDVVADLPGGARGFQVLSVVSAADCGNQAAIAERLGLDRTTMTYLLDDLQKHRLVSRRPDPADRRARQVILTKTGAATLARLADHVGRVEANLLSGLSAADAATLRMLLARAARASESHDPSETACEIAQSLDSDPGSAYSAASATSRPSAADR
jgi:DNA-binding MarR family transcriptional regulator